MDIWNDKILLGTTDNGRPVYITYGQLYRHLMIIGGSDMGKSSVFEILIRAFIEHGQGLTLIDPHGSLYDKVVAWMAYHGVHKFRKIHLIEPAAEEWCVGVNPFAVPAGMEYGPDYEEYLVNRVYPIMDAIAQAWGGEDLNNMPRYQTYFAPLAVALGAGGFMLSEMPELMPANRTVLRQRLAEGITHPTMVPNLEEILNKRPHDWSAESGSSFSRLLRVLRSSAIRETLGQKNAFMDFRRVMDEGEIVLINLGIKKPYWNSDDAQVLGKIIVSLMFEAAQERPADVSRPHYLLIDECYKFLGNNISEMLMETRKRGLHLALGLQHLGQLSYPGPLVYDGVLSGTQSKLILGALKADDSRILADCRDYYDPEKPVQALIRPIQTGVKLRKFKNASKSDISTDVYPGGTTAEDDDGRTVVVTPDGPTKGIVSGNQDGYSEGLEPEYTNLPTQLESLETQREIEAVKLRKQEQQHGTLIPPVGLGTEEEFKFTSLAQDYASEKFVAETKEEIREASTATSRRPIVIEELEARRKDLLAISQQSDRRINLKKDDFSDAIPVKKKRKK